MTELVQCHAAEIEHAGPLVAAIRVPAAPLVEDDIRLGDRVAARRVERLRDRHDARAEWLAKHVVREAGGVETVARRDRGRIAARAECDAIQIRVPHAEGGFGDAVPVAAAVDQRRRG